MVCAERLETPEDFIDAIQLAVKREHIAAMYGLPKSGNKKIAIKSGRLLKGGEPCVRTTAIMSYVTIRGVDYRIMWPHQN